ncbi:hypothetical protein OV079_40420 [Nannocystis pusilla]|uniref:Uncharacterized protein n=1 Tax=Nannocystis pusilla TaxID=889268 RepID=A0A9X3J227_9BACT|nr:hypothetical protein [Nannocystis pusilla]MCY1011725.1 hypothetical protein [Nannocystis pusilla]
MIVSGPTRVRASGARPTARAEPEAAAGTVVLRQRLCQSARARDRGDHLRHAGLVGHQGATGEVEVVGVVIVAEQHRVEAAERRRVRRRLVALLAGEP